MQRRYCNDACIHTRWGSAVRSRAQKIRGSLTAKPTKQPNGGCLRCGVRVPPTALLTLGSVGNRKEGSFIRDNRHAPCWAGDRKCPALFLLQAGDNGCKGRMVAAGGKTLRSAVSPTGSNAPECRSPSGSSPGCSGPRPGPG